MIAWLRLFLMRTFNLVDRQDLDNVWAKWSKAVLNDFDTLRRIQNSLDILTRLSIDLTRENLELQKSNKRLLLDALIVDVAPFETMERALMILESSHVCEQEVCLNAEHRAINELSSGIRMVRKIHAQKKGKSNGSHIAA